MPSRGLFGRGTCITPGILWRLQVKPMSRGHIKLSTVIVPLGRRFPLVLMEKLVTAHWVFHAPVVI